MNAGCEQMWSSYGHLRVHEGANGQAVGLGDMAAKLGFALECHPSNGSRKSFLLHVPFFLSSILEAFPHPRSCGAPLPHVSPNHGTDMILSV